MAARLVPRRAFRFVDEVGRMFSVGLESVHTIFRRPWPLQEFLEQVWFIAKVTLVPVILISIPFGMVISLQVGQFARELGAQAHIGAAMVLAVVREEAPVATALLIAGAGGSAMCADLGSRRIRDEIDAMEVLGVSPLQRLVVPRVLATMLVAFFLNGLVSVVGVVGGYFFNVILQGGTPGAYLASFSALAQVQDFWSGEFKALVFGLIAGIVASYKGLNAKGGPKGVGDAVNQTVVISFMLLFLTNFIITAIYFQVIPQKGG